MAVVFDNVGDGEANMITQAPQIAIDAAGRKTMNAKDPTLVVLYEINAVTEAAIVRDPRRGCPFDEQVF